MKAWALLLITIFISMACNAAQPPRFNYQAELSDGNGQPLHGTQSLIFCIFEGGTATSANSGALKYKETALANASNGVVSHTVGTGTPVGNTLDASIFNSNTDLFLQVAVSVENNVILPRTRLESVPFAIASADGEKRRTISTPASFPIRIETPGSYYLTENLDVPISTSAIVINANNVVLDLGGFSVSGRHLADSSGIATEQSPESIKVYNGSISGFGRGVALGQARFVQVQDIRATSNTISGIEVGNASVVEDCVASYNQGTGASITGIYAISDCIVRRCTANYNGTSDGSGQAIGIRCNDNSLVESCVANGNIGGGSSSSDSAIGIFVDDGCRVLNCVASHNTCSGSGTTGVTGIHGGDHCEISGNVCTNNITSQVGGKACGIDVSSNCYIHRNECYNNRKSPAGTGESAGIRMFSFNRVENNHCSNHSGSTTFNCGIIAYGSTNSKNIIIRNTLVDNDTVSLRLDNNAGSNYSAENISGDPTFASQRAGGTHVQGTGDRANVSF